MRSLLYWFLRRNFLKFGSLRCLCIYFHTLQTNLNHAEPLSVGPLFVGPLSVGLQFVETQSAELQFVELLLAEQIHFARTLDLGIRSEM